MNLPSNLIFRFLTTASFQNIPFALHLATKFKGWFLYYIAMPITSLGSKIEGVT